jgi:hypothetical protein
MKKTIAKHTLGLIGTVILWFILNPKFDVWMGRTYYYSDGIQENYDNWNTSIDDDGGFLLLGMLVGYIVVYWAVKTIWFTKDKE